MEDLRTLLPHSKKDVKLDQKDELFAVNEICEMKSCNNCIFFEVRKKLDLYMWLSKPPNGPSAKFLVQNIHTMDELKLTGNCLKGSRPLLTFDKNFDSEPHLLLLKELFIQAFGTPNRHPKSKPFIDHVFCFSIVDKRIWFRNYQIVQQQGERQNKKESNNILVEIGPRFVLNLIRIFGSSFAGETLYQNYHYVSPNLKRAETRRPKDFAYKERVTAKKKFEKRKRALPLLPPKDFGEVFQENKLERSFDKPIN